MLEKGGCGHDGRVTHTGQDKSTEQKGGVEIFGKTSVNLNMFHRVPEEQDFSLNCISGKERQVAVIDVAHLRHVTHVTTSPGNVTPRNVEQAYACTCLALGWIGDGLFMCAALADRILILKWNQNQANFSIRKVQLSAAVRQQTILPFCMFLFG